MPDYSLSQEHTILRQAVLPPVILRSVEMRPPFAVRPASMQRLSPALHPKTIPPYPHLHTVDNGPEPGGLAQVCTPPWLAVHVVEFEVWWLDCADRGPARQWDDRVHRHRI